MQMNEAVRVRLTGQQLAKMDSLIQQTKSNKSKIIRDLIDAAEVVPAQISVRLPSANGVGRNTEQLQCVV